MLENKSFADGIQFAWDSTSIKLAEECFYKYYLRMIEGWRPIQISPHLSFGGWYATALEHYHKHRASSISHNEALNLVVHEALINSWEHERDGEGNRIPNTGVAWTSSDPVKTRENLIRTIVWYLEQFGEEDNCKTIILSDGSAAVEHSFRIPVDNSIVFCGHLDRLVEFSHKIFIQDQKTSKSTITSRFFQNYNPDSQIAGMYPFAGQIIFNLPIKGVMLDAAQIAVGFSRFERGFVFTDKGSLDEWYDDTMDLILRVQSATRENHFPKNRGSCSKFAGCEFREICSKSPAVRKNFLAASFTKGNIWDPIRSR